MALKHYLTLMIFGTAACWVTWLVALFRIDPFVSGFIGQASFFLSFFLALLGSFSILGFLFRRAFSKDAVAFHHVGISMRQGLFFALIVVGSLLLRGTGLFTWWSIAFLLGGLTVLEFFFLTREAS